MTHEAWDVPARTAFRDLELWSHKWRGIDGGDGARLAGMLARLMIRVVPEAKLGSLRVALDALIADRLRGHLDAEQLEQAAGNFVESLQARPAPSAPLPPARVVVPPWRCRWFGHAWRKGLPSLGGPVLYCEREGCLEERHWPPYPRPAAVQLARGTIVGVAGEAVPAGGLVSVSLSGQIVGACGGGARCGKPYDDSGGEGCTRELGHEGGCRASTWGKGYTSSTTGPQRLGGGCASSSGFSSTGTGQMGGSNSGAGGSTTGISAGTGGCSSSRGGAGPTGRSS